MMTSDRPLMSPVDVWDEEYRLECKQGQSSEKNVAALAFSSEMAAVENLS